MSDEFIIKLSSGGAESLLRSTYGEIPTKLKINDIVYKIKKIDVENNQVICTKE